LWDGSIGQRLVAASCDQIDDRSARHTGLFIFAQSAKHVGLYGKFGFRPRFLTAIMAAPARRADHDERRLPLLGITRQAAAGSRKRSSRIDRRAVSRSRPARRNPHGRARALGDTALLWNQERRLAGFAVCHWGPASEAGEGCCFVKFGTIRPGPGAEARFGALLDACAALAREAGMPNVLAGANLAREEAYRHMLVRGFRTMIQAVTMHRPNEPGYSGRGFYVLDDWR